MKVKVDVEGEEGIGEGDIASVIVNMDRVNLKNDQETGFVHQTYLEELKLEEIYLILCEESERSLTGTYRYTLCFLTDSS